MGLSLRDFGEKVSLSHATIKKYEDGLLTPPADALALFAKELSVELPYFAPRPQSNLTLGSIEFRIKGELPVKVLDAMRNDVLERLERRLELESLFPQSPVRPFQKPIIAWVRTLDDVDLLAERVRTEWNLGCGPLWGLTDVLEENGIHVFQVDFGRDHHFDGMTAICGELPLIVLGKGWPGDRQRFTLAHELGHQLLQSAKLKKGFTLEEACNRFAGAFLFPRSSVCRELGVHRTNLDIKELMLLKEQYGISLQAILHRCHELGVITGTNYSELHAMFKKNGWDEVEPGEALPTEVARLHERLVCRAVAEGFV